MINVVICCIVICLDILLYSFCIATVHAYIPGPVLVAEYNRRGRLLDGKTVEQVLKEDGGMANQRTVVYEIQNTPGGGQTLSNGTHMVFLPRENIWMGPQDFEGMSTVIAVTNNHQIIRLDCEKFMATMTMEPTLQDSHVTSTSNCIVCVAPMGV